MKFSCSQKDILRAINIAQKATGSTGTLPILENVLISAEGQIVEISATNLDISITTTIDANVHNEGKTTLPAKTIVSWIGLTAGETIEFSKSEGEKINVKSQGSKTTIKGISADEFPVIPFVEKENSCTISQKAFKTTLDQVVFCAAAGGTRPVLSGIFFTTDGDELILAGTDSYRLSEKKIPFKTPPKESVSCIIPAKTLLELERILSPEEDGELEIIFSKHQILFLFNGVRIVSRLIEGQFPNYQQIIPKSYQSTVEIDRPSLIRTVKRVGIFARENNNNIKLMFKKSELEITTDITEIGTEEAVLPITNSNGESAVALNSQFFLDVLQVLDGDTVELHIGEKLNPISITSPKNKGFLHVIMPLKI